MPDFGSFRGFGEKLTQGQTPTQIGNDVNYYSDSLEIPYICYSVRKLIAGYSGNCIRVRRSNDNTEQNIGFYKDELDTASLLSFVGSNNGFVTTWYDQSGNGNNLTQSTASEQPQIVSSGVLYYINSKPTIFSAGKLLSFTLGTNITSSSVLIASVYNLPIVATNYGSIFTKSIGTTLSYNVSGNIRKSKATNFVSGGFNVPMESSAGLVQNFNVMNYLEIYGSTEANIAFDISNGVVTSKPFTNISNSYNKFFLGREIAANPLHHYISELIFYNKDYFAKYKEIQSNLNSYYGIY
jgi:hypothetical protein